MAGAAPANAETQGDGKGGVLAKVLGKGTGFRLSPE
jgi:hypothetical protein